MFVNPDTGSTTGMLIDFYKFKKQMEDGSTRNSCLGDFWLALWDTSSAYNEHSEDRTNLEQDEGLEGDQIVDVIDDYGPNQTLGENTRVEDRNPNWTEAIHQSELWQMRLLLEQITTFEVCSKAIKRHFQVGGIAADFNTIARRITQFRWWFNDLKSVGKRGLSS